MTGVHAREWKGVAPTHRPVAFKGLTLLFTKDDGSITDLHVYVDVAVVKAQLAVGPKELVGLAAPTMPTGSFQDLDQSLPISADETRNENVVKGSLDALEQNKEAGYLDAMTDDVEVITLDRVLPIRGKAEAKAYYRTMHKVIGQLDTTVMNAWGVKSFAVVEYSVAGEQLGPIGFIPARRDAVVRYEVVDLCEIRDGKIARVWRYDNPAEMLEP